MQYYNQKNNHSKNNNNFISNKIIIGLKTLLLFSVLLLVSSSCKQLNSFKDFTTYFNTYYNANRLMNEAEDEFAFFDEKLRVNPRVIVPTPEIYTPNFVPLGPPAFMESFIVKQHKRQPVAVKLDSIIIKGSKILGTAPKSEYVENTLFLMAKTYYYREEWLNAQVKCGELIDIYPDGDLSPDAHLLYSKTLIIERKFIQGKMMLSRCVDIAWYKKRYDILSDAFRFQAELSIFEKDIEGAIRPYHQAITQTDDNSLKAKWQLDLASLLYRMGYFDKAEKEFAKVFNYKPDYLGQFEANLYRAASLNRLQKYEEAAVLLTDLEDDGKFTEWKGYAFAERLQSLRLQNDTASLSVAEKYADTAFIGNPLVQCYYFDKGMAHYKANEYNKAQKCFVRVQGTKTPVSNTAKDMFKALSELEERYAWISPTMKKIEAGEMPNDTVSFQTSSYLFEMSRTHELLKNQDSALYYIQKSYEISPKNNPKSARFLYAYSRLIRDKDPIMSDSLYEVLAEKYMDTEYGAEAANVLGFTKEYKIDKVQDLFTSGSSHRINGDFTYANHQFLRIYNEYPKNELAAKSLYTIGFIFENNLKIADSAFYYYSLLIEKYPNSIYAQDVKGSLTLYAAAAANGGVLPDSLIMKKETYKKMDLSEEERKYKEQLKILEAQNKEQQIKNDKGGFDILNPANALEQAKEFFKGQADKALNFDPKSLLPTMPNLDSLSKTLPQSLMPQSNDSTKQNSGGQNSGGSNSGNNNGIDDKTAEENRKEEEAKRKQEQEQRESQQKESEKSDSTKTPAIIEPKPKKK